jgi:phosphoserine aminotransferase
VLFLQGGAIAENAIVPMNLLGRRTDRRLRQHRRMVEEVDQGSPKYCQVRIVASSEDTNYTSIPALGTWQLDRNAAYVHICTNETIGGIEYHWTPETGDVPLVADMSSHILSEVIDVSKYGVIYCRRAEECRDGRD